MKYYDEYYKEHNDTPHFNQQNLGQIWKNPMRVQNFINKSLIKWDGDKGSFVMHNQLHDFGWSIANDNNGESTQIWKANDVVQHMREDNVSDFVSHMVCWLWIWDGCIYLGLETMYSCIQQFEWPWIVILTRKLFDCGNFDFIEVQDFGRFIILQCKSLSWLHQLWRSLHCYLLR